MIIYYVSVLIFKKKKLLDGKKIVHDNCIYDNSYCYKHLFIITQTYFSFYLIINYTNFFFLFYNKWILYKLIEVYYVIIFIVLYKLTKLY